MSERKDEELARLLRRLEEKQEMLDSIERDHREAVESVLAAHRAISAHRLRLRGLKAEQRGAQAPPKEAGAA